MLTGKLPIKPVGDQESYYFDIVKVNKEGKKQQRVLVLSSDGVRNLLDDRVRWFAENTIVLAIAPKEPGSRFFTLTLLCKYHFQAKSAEQLGRIVKSFQSFNLHTRGMDILNHERSIIMEIPRSLPLTSNTTTTVPHPYAPKAPPEGRLNNGIRRVIDEIEEKKKAPITGKDVLETTAKVAAIAGYVLLAAV
ncbi:uncharacterized protein MONOS_9713 [Monocercomonoides exilis]|uniref:uncharacterized protein n=1 Tax=Monocercomonoides exilis TaxID=2049356 RepID=UPI003559AFF3|nr:hypothetical protein MONOS_9713 [Monocercomonoides exilis]|eukprot:MONOS_9713.1-p1 / transcript=MONOS_9713.1 / gene=MONOS_9713 / organism=Monocercomonoides_exilis_PA203 / gene_product=unspecified product / transcript_product=unspecified product / location=Mono_scaffold00411:32237-32874(-) / protein_length=192 / sequence_SO=supercontig / SO=protein_coding / is_pseudo=false